MSSLGYAMDFFRTHPFSRLGYALGDAQTHSLPDLPLKPLYAIVVETFGRYLGHSIELETSRIREDMLAELQRIYGAMGKYLAQSGVQFFPHSQIKELELMILNTLFLYSDQIGVVIEDACCNGFRQVTETWALDAIETLQSRICGPKEKGKIADFMKIHNVAGIAGVFHSGGIPSFMIAEYSCQEGYPFRIPVSCLLPVKRGEDGVPQDFFSSEKLPYGGRRMVIDNNMRSGRTIGSVKRYFKSMDVNDIIYMILFGAERNRRRNELSLSAFFNN